jgi:hypothetical protein
MSGDGLRRFLWLRRLIREVKPDKVISIGDFVTMDCLSEWDRDKRKKMEGRRYRDDIDCGRAALDVLQKGNRNSNIEWVYIEGNHEERLARYLDRDPTFDGVVGVHKDLCADWTWVPYRTNYMVEGTAYTHIPMNAMNKPAGGKYVVQKALDLYSCSVVFGHTHNLSVGCSYRHVGAHLQQALNIGCFFEGVDDYAVGSLTTYWRGVVVLDHYSTNRFDFETISLGRLKKEYGDGK